MANTPKIGMPEIAEAQASKYLTHNTALRYLDALVQPTVIDKDLGEPPGSPSDGDTYIVGGTPSSDSDWNGFDDYIAYYNSTSWVFIQPSEGWRVYVVDEDSQYEYQSASAGWVIVTGGGSGTFTALTDTPANFTSQAYKTVRVNSGETALEFTDNNYDVGGGYNGVLPSSQVLLRLPMVRAVTFPDDLSGSQGYAGTTATASTEFSIQKDGVEFGTMTFGIGASTATFATASTGAEVFAAGDVLMVVAPSSADATLANIGFLLKGYKS